ncbi:hypothetical protein [Carboxylicivirga linearis]|uniref:SGNH/GDSL hydrolase family protein n=1 Tax=Carboxylicivirga linearis TaxID=1628157 RepID=A0ABS5JX71_9BACT|nr:hypothetical protein [Carboxylicivirga linearis]MBS2099061.1 hypothetical protein [Carboxylicivirga linearis]
MKNINKRLIYFTCILLVLLMGSFYINAYYYKIKAYNIPTSTKTLITGSSLVANGVDPQYIPNSVNIALAAEPLCLSYFKLKDILNREHEGLNTVVVSYSLPDISYDWDNVFIQSKKVSGEMLKRIFSLENGPGPLELGSIFPLDWFIASETYLRYRVFPNLSDWSVYWSKNKHPGYIGSYLPADSYFRKDTVVYEKFLRNHFPLPAITYQPVVGKMNSYIDSIQNLINDHQLSLVTLGFPIVDTFNLAIPELYKSAFDNQLNKLNAQNSGQWQHFQFEIRDRSLFSDYLHLNKEGAIQFSERLSKVIYNDFE